MTSMPASLRARAMILAPRSWPSRPTFATTTLIVRAIVPYSNRSDSPRHTPSQPRPSRFQQQPVVVPEEHVRNRSQVRYIRHLHTERGKPPPEGEGGRLVRQGE